MNNKSDKEILDSIFNPKSQYVTRSDVTIREIALRHINPVDSCENKIAYRTPEYAQKKCDENEAVYKKPFIYYHCHFCHQYHLTSSTGSPNFYEPTRKQKIISELYSMIQRFIKKNKTIIENIETIYNSTTDKPIGEFIIISNGRRYKILIEEQKKK